MLQPLLLGRAVRVHPLAVVLSIAAGLLVGGIFGALIAVPIVACGNVAGTYLSRRHDGPRPPRRVPTRRARRRAPAELRPGLSAAAIRPSTAAGAMSVRPCAPRRPGDPLVGRRRAAARSSPVAVHREHPPPAAPRCRQRRSGARVQHALGVGARPPV